MWGRKELVAFGAALAVVVVVAVGYGLARGRRVDAAPVAGRDARVERLVGPDGGAAAQVTDEERRAATERLTAVCRDLEVRLAYNGPLEARPMAEPTSAPSGSRCARRALTDAEVLRLRYVPPAPPGEPLFADERQLAEWKRDQLCRRPELRAATAASPTAGPGTPDGLRGICGKASLGPDELRALRGIYVADPVAAERARRQRELERQALAEAAARTTPTP